MVDNPELTALHEKVVARLRTASPAVIPIECDHDGSRTLWRACELCSYLDHRMAEAVAPPDPRHLTDADIDNWSARALLPGERITDPRRSDWYSYYWLHAEHERLGTLALRLSDSGWGEPALEFASLYIFPEHRRQGHAKRLLAALAEVTAAFGLAALRLETDWLWQPAVRLYLDSGFALVHWKHGLRMARWPSWPTPEARFSSDSIELLRAPGQAALLSATRDGDQLRWFDHRTPAEREDNIHWLRWEPTLALWLATHGWPLIRSAQTWALRWRWMDSGMPEGLARRIQVWEAYARHHGLPVRTPRIPGLGYPNWDASQFDGAGQSATTRIIGNQFLETHPGGRQ
jgi:GNAT superfamily N-acetyltransferase